MAVFLTTGHPLHACCVGHLTVGVQVLVRWFG